MKYNNIFDTQVSQLGLGFMRHNNLNDSKNLTCFAINNGINYFEACSFYLNNQCEEIVSKSLLPYKREQYILCDKLPILGTDWESIDLELFFNNQLKKCNVDYFDVYLLQALDRKCLPILNKYNIINFIEQKKKEGKIKYIGFSFHDTPNILNQIIPLAKWDCAQIQLNYYDYYKNFGKENYELLTRYNIPIIVMEPCKGGLLTNRLPQKIQNDFSQAFPNNTLQELCYKFLLSLDNVKIILSGAEKIEWLQQNINMCNINTKITDKELQIIQIILQYYHSEYINCTGCAYCKKVCTISVEISKNFWYYNTIINNCFDREEYSSFLKEHNTFLDCINCGRCERICPQHLPIRKLFSEKLWSTKL